MRKRLQKKVLAGLMSIALAVPSVSISGTGYTVTAIGKKAFAGAKAKGVSSKANKKVFCAITPTREWGT